MPVPTSSERGQRGDLAPTDVPQTIPLSVLSPAPALHLSHSSLFALELGP